MAFRKPEDLLTQCLPPLFGAGGKANVQTVATPIGRGPRADAERAANAAKAKADAKAAEASRPQSDRAASVATGVAQRARLIGELDSPGMPSQGAPAIPDGKEMDVGLRASTPEVVS